MKHTKGDWKLMHRNCEDDDLVIHLIAEELWKLNTYVKVQYW